MKKFFRALFFGKVTAVLFPVLALCAVPVYYAFRNTFYFIDDAIFRGFTMTLFLLMALNAFQLFLLSGLRLRDRTYLTRKWVRALYVVGGVYAVVSAGVCIGFFFGNSAETNTVTRRCLLEILPYWAAAAALLLALFILPNLQKKKLRAGLCAALSAALLVSCAAALFPFTPYRFTSGPVVFDNGTDYSVVFSTSGKGTGYVTYTYGGETVTRYDEAAGRKAGDSTIHTVRVPYAELQNNTYTVGSVRILEDRSYGGRSGKAIESEPVEFGGVFGETVRALTVSDWHTHTDLAKSTAAQLGGYDALLLLGDSAPGMMFASEVVDYILQFASDLGGGSTPVLFVRGNHETRGREAGKLPEYLGFDSFYFTAQLGDYRFVVLDSGEDKADDHPEYGNMVTYSESRANMVAWLEGLENPDGAKTVALSHADSVCIEEDLSAAAHEKLDALGVSLLVSGHAHKTEFKTEHAYPTLIDGGWTANGAGTYVASMLVFSPDGIALRSVDNAGVVTVEESVAWR